MTLDAWRISFRLHRFAISVMAVAGAVFAFLAASYVIRLGSFPDAINCILEGGEECQGFAGLQEEGQRVLLALFLTPVIAALFLGVAVVAEELDRSTVILAWSLEPSRLRWFAQRLVPLLVFLGVTALVLGVLGDQLEGKLSPLTPPAESFRDFGLRGPMVLARTMLAVGCGVLVGIVVGRGLQAILIASLLFVVIGASIASVHQGVLVGESITMPLENVSDGFAGLQVDFRYRLPTGDLVTSEELDARFPDPAERDRQLADSQQIVSVIPANRYQVVSIREAAVTAGVGLVMLMASVPILLRRPATPGAIRLGLRRRRHSARSAGSRTPPVNLTIIDGLRLALWPNRFELAAGFAIGLVLTAGFVVVVVSLRSLAPPIECFRDLSSIPTTGDCATADDFLLLASEWGNRLFAAMAVTPWIVGALIGVVIVGREIEQRTATLAWSLSPDRRRWLFVRVVVAGGLVAALLAIPALLSSDLQRIGRPWVEPGATIENYGLRGPLIIGRGLVGFSVGLLTGAYLGRILPALLVSGAACVGIVMLLNLLFPFGVSVDGSGATAVAEIEVREGLFLAAVVFSLTWATGIVVQRRRPY